jgi:Fe2+ transport system protein FeoA
VVLQVGFKYRSAGDRSARGAAPETLVDLREGEAGVVERLDVPDDIAFRLMELGFLPGGEVVAARSAPGGDPRVFRVDGSEIALRRETAGRIFLQSAGKP